MSTTASIATLGAQGWVNNAGYGSELVSAGPRQKAPAESCRPSKPQCMNTVIGSASPTETGAELGCTSTAPGGSEAGAEGADDGGDGSAADDEPAGP